MQLDLDSIRPVSSPRVIGGGLEGAERTSRETLKWDSPIISPDRQINPVKEDADARGRDMVQNNGYVMGAVQTHKDGIVGAQYRLNCQPDYELLGATEDWAEQFQLFVESYFNLFAEDPECWFDAARNKTFTDIIRLVVGGFCFTGEALSTAEWMDREPERPFKTAIQLVSPSRLCNPDMQPDSKTLRRGIERNVYGRAIKYWFKKTHPGDLFMDPSANLGWVPVDARKPWGRRQVIHIIEPLQADQTRGIADMVSVLKQMRMTKKFSEITLQNAVVNATYAAAVESELPKDLVFGSMGMGQTGFEEMLGGYLSSLQEYIGAAGNIAIDGVKMPHLFPGTKLSLKPMGTPGGVGTDFEASLLRHIAAPLGMSYEEFSRDFTKTNYSSARASMGQTWKFLQARKKSVADKYATMVYHLWFEEQMNLGRVPLPPGFTPETYYSDPGKRAALLACDWIGASRGQIDELKETEAAVLRIERGLSTLELENGRLGQDWRKTMRQRARETKLSKKLGLDFSAQAGKPAADGAKVKKEETADAED